MKARGFELRTIDAIDDVWCEFNIHLTRNFGHNNIYQVSLYQYIYQVSLFFCFYITHKPIEHFWKLAQLQESASLLIGWSL